VDFNNRSRQFQGLLASVGIAGLWIFLLPQVSDELNFTVIAVVGAVLCLALTQQLRSAEDYKALLWLLAPFAFLLILTLTTSFFRMPGFTALREVLLVAAVFAAGLLFSRIAGLHFALLGVLLGSSAGAVFSWFLVLDDSSSIGAFLEGGILTGFAGNRAIDYVSALMGIAAGLSLMRTTHWSRLGIISLVGFLALTLISSGSLTGRVALLATFVAVGLLLLSQTRFQAVAAWSALATGILGSILLILFFVFQGRAVAIASAFSKSDSLEARFLSWAAILKALDPAGIVFGYGTTFWQEGSPAREAANEPLEAVGIRGFSISHSIYLELFQAFGLVGLVAVGLVIFIILRSALSQRKVTSKWAEFSAPWIFVVAIAIHGITDSVLSYRPVGWLLLGLLCGAFVSRTGINQFFKQKASVRRAVRSVQLARLP